MAKDPGQRSLGGQSEVISGEAVAGYSGIEAGEAVAGWVHSAGHDLAGRVHPATRSREVT